MSDSTLRVIPITAEPAKRVSELLEHVLEQARNGEVIAVTLLVTLSDGTLSHGHTGVCEHDLMRQLAEFTRLAHIVQRRLDED